MRAGVVIALILALFPHEEFTANRYACYGALIGLLLLFHGNKKLAQAEHYQK